MHLGKRGKGLLASTLAAITVGIGVFAAGGDFGKEVEKQLANDSEKWFGVEKPLIKSSTKSLTEAQAQANPAKLATVAKGLKVKVVTDEAGANTDMMILWPNDKDATHIISCNEGGTDEPGVQRTNLSTGTVETIVTGTDSCDGIRRTAWGTVLFTEEAGGGPDGGRAYELQDPLNTTGVTLDRETGEFSGGTGSENLVVRTALGRLSFEGLAVYPNGVVYYGDELRPSEGTPGGAYYKFVPKNPAGAAAGSGLDASPLKSGNIYGLRLGLRDEATDYGQGSQTGMGTWVEVCKNCDDNDLGAKAAELHLTGYYRPEDIDIDGKWAKKGLVRFCGPNTGNESDNQNYGEVVCITDGKLSDAVANKSVPEVQYLVMGHPGLAMPDNIGYQPGRGNWLIMEDGATDHIKPHNNDIWSCMDDGKDENLLSDGCVRVVTLNDLEAEATGGFFDAKAKRFFVSVQHNISGTGVILEITGWK